MTRKIIRLTESELHNIVSQSVKRILKEVNEGTPPQNDFIRSLCKKRGIAYNNRYDSLSVKDASSLITMLKKLRVKNGEQPPRIEDLLTQASAVQPKPTNPSFMKYEDVTPELVNKFWSKDGYADKLVDISNIRPEFVQAYERAKKNVAMLAYAMSPSYTVYFDREANLTIHVNTGASWSNQNHLHHYAEKSGHFGLQTAASGMIDHDNWELLYDGYERWLKI